MSIPMLYDGAVRAISLTTSEGAESGVYVQLILSDQEEDVVFLADHEVAASLGVMLLQATGATPIDITPTPEEETTNG